MRILVENMGERDIRLLFPTGLVFNPLFLPAAAASYGMHITPRQAMALIRAIRDCKHRYPDWVMVEAESAGGRVEIRL